MTRAPLLIVVAFALALPLAACGKRADPQAPKDEPVTYPAQYPRDYHKLPEETPAPPPTYKRDGN